MLKIITCKGASKLSDVWRRVCVVLCFPLDSDYTMPCILLFSKLACISSFGILHTGAMLSSLPFAFVCIAVARTLWNKVAFNCFSSQFYFTPLLTKVSASAA
ncbi:hypothetical protein, unlikely [Trypanosoma brucei gambiense DAL972]|uniref:Uncharacterized protein n=1 Tax=Trypanosoma brucei gambiense (strain MHOM/CI/86/DAL972) TaxID=679716 RepID=C9ZTS7_TRYB9|nr:hypothetical protein, unlikely [Trypanosoma brucei gambiense DAL972]CBH12813.1 hypothetical protein, unlikely [Trypanosoma brucei gambiense DAL972]|eukprot:XP_011775092.1 hypothetical protein, unlikely [Trypanosoma brucei gambiense DAL972]